MQLIIWNGGVPSIIHCKKPEQSSILLIQPDKDAARRDKRGVGGGGLRRAKQLAEFLP